MDNGPARKTLNGPDLQRSGEEIADPFEVSILRREDVAFHKGKIEGDDVNQCAMEPSSRTHRGHQG